MTKTTLLKSITLPFSFGMMALFVAYRMGAFEEKKNHAESEELIESNVPGYVSESSGMVKKFSDFTEPKERPMHDLELLPTSKSTVILTDHPLLQYPPADSKIRKNAQSTELSAEELFILSSSKSALIIEPEKLSFPLTNPDSIKKPN